jgi:hypothetical protein
MPKLLPAVFFFCAASLVTWSGEFNVQIEIPKPLPEGSIISASVPLDFPTAGVLKGKECISPFQKLGRSEARFFLPKGLSGNVNLRTTPAALDEGMRARLQNGKIALTSAGKNIFVYQGEESALPRPGIKEIFKRGGYIHPVWTPAGKLVTDDYAPNHLHHHGIWFPWTKTEFEGRSPDFWNMGEGKGKVEFVKFGETWSGPVHAGFTAQHRFIDLTSGSPKAALEETWQVVAYNVSSQARPYWLFDLVSTQICSSASALKLPKYLYGGLGFRGNWSWNGATNAFFLTSTGETNRVKGNETRADWCYIGGSVDGEQAGLAILGHPSNFRSPQPMRLHPGEPFFCFAPSQLGDWAIEPEKPYISRYRFVVFDGPPVKAELDALWEAYAHPPRVQISTVSTP